MRACACVCVREALDIITDSMGGMTTTTDIENLTTRAHEVKVVLQRLMATIEAAEAEANEVTWEEEKETALSDALSTVQWRCQKLAHDMKYSDDDTVLRLSERG